LIPIVPPKLPATDGFEGNILIFGFAVASCCLLVTGAVKAAFMVGYTVSACIILFGRVDPAPPLSNNPPPPADY